MPIPFLGYVAASLGVAAVMALGKCLFDDLSEDERRKQKQIENNFEAYQSANEKRRSDFAVEYKRKIEEKRRDSAHDAYLYRKRILEQIRVANRPFFDKVIVELDEQIQTYQELNKQVYNSLQKLKDEAISASETSILRGDSLRVIKDECYESLTELKAYVSCVCVDNFLKVCILCSRIALLTCDIVKVENNENTDSPRESVSSVGFFYARKRADVANRLGIRRYDIG